MWKTFNGVLNKDTQSTVLSNINKDGKVLTKDLDMLEALNHHLVSVGTNLAKKQPQSQFMIALSMSYLLMVK